LNVANQIRFGSLRGERSQADHQGHGSRSGLP
jgi:hypothetical protein